MTSWRWLPAAAACLLGGILSAWPQESNFKRVSFYSVDLVCPAAPRIGCGSAAKPLLLQLEGDTNVTSAWLNRQGTIMAISWKDNVSARRRAKVVATLLADRGPVELKGASREKALESYPSAGAWYRGAEVDRLSEEEAGIIAGRLVRRIGKQVSATEEKAKALEAGMREVLKRRLIEGGLGDHDQLEKELLAVCQQHLDDQQIATLKQAHENGAFSHLRDD